MRRKLRGVRRQVRAAAPAGCEGVDGVSRMQETGAEGVFDVQFAEEPVDIGREEGGVHGVETSRERRV